MDARIKSGHDGGGYSSVRALLPLRLYARFDFTTLGWNTPLASAAAAGERRAPGFFSGFFRLMGFFDLATTRFVHHVTY